MSLGQDSAEEDLFSWRQHVASYDRRMDTDAIRKPSSIHLGVDLPLRARFKTDARSRGMSVIELELDEISDVAALCNYLAAAFMFPHETTGLDAAIDLISDLEWFGSAGGYMVLARGLRDSSPIAGAFVSILPNIIDRWRGQAVPFVVAIDGRGLGLEAALRAANDAMERAGRLPWAQPGTCAVDVIVHSADEGAGG